MNRRTEEVLADLVSGNNYVAIDESPRLVDFVRSHISAAVFRFRSDPKAPGPAILPRSGVTLVHICAYFDCLETLVWLRRHNADVRQPSADSYHPIHYACEGNSPECVSYILSLDPNSVRLDFVSEHSHVFLAVCIGAPMILRMFLVRRIDFADHRDVLSLCVHQAIKNGNFECLRLLVEYARTAVLQCDDRSALMTAALFGFSDAFPLLLDYGSDPHFVGFRGQTALSIACRMGNVEMVGLLLKSLNRADLRPDLTWPSAFHWACQSLNTEIVEMVMAHGCDVYRVDHHLRQGIDYLVDQDIEKVMDILSVLVRKGYELNRRTGCVHSLLFVFAVDAILPQMDIVRFLLDHRAAAAPDSFEGIIERAWKQDVKECLVEFCATGRVLDD
jgi:ankyrin repeat protein